MEPTAPFNLLNSFWQTQLQIIEESELDFKNFSLPLARIKKVMKVDEDVKHMMISAEAPVVFAKACEIFILELTLRSWIQTEDGKRRTLQRADVTSAVGKNDVFDFLIDILPQRGEDGKGGKRVVDAVDYRPPMAAGSDGYFYSAPMNFNMPPADPNLMYNQQQMNYLRQPFMNGALPQDQSNTFHDA